MRHITFTTVLAAVMILSLLLTAVPISATEECHNLLQLPALAVGNGTANGLLEAPKDLGPGEFQVLITDMYKGVGIPGMIEFNKIGLTVTETPYLMTK